MMRKKSPDKDRVIYNGEQCRIEWSRGGFLFEPYLKKHRIVLYPYYTAMVRMGCTTWMIERGYTATWTIEDDMLFLVDIQANILPQYILEEMGIPSSVCYVGLDYFFPTDERKIFADWYSGELTILYKYNSAAPEDVQYMVFTVGKGRVISQKLQNYEEYHGLPYGIICCYPFDGQVEDDGLPF